MAIYNMHNTNQIHHQNYFTVSLFDHFEKTVSQHKSKIAVVDENESLTFSELLSRINNLARCLQTKKINQEKFIGVFMYRSCDLIVSLFALIKLGITFVPLDPNYPMSRIEYMIQDSEMNYILTSSVLMGQLNTHANKLIAIDQYDKPCNEVDSFVNQPCDLASPLYLLYTSGSTGKPKGVLGSHIGLLNRCYWMWKAYPFGEDEICCQKTAISFVDSLWEIFGPLLQGIKLIIIKEKMIRSIRNFKNYLSQEKITRLVVVPSLLEALLDDANVISHLSICITSGEALTPSLARKFKRMYPDAKLLNLYGSTEVAGDVTCYDIDEWNSNEGSVPIGKPIDNTAIYVLDENMQPVPIGLEGKLYASGLGVSLGYWKRAQEMSRTFFIHPKTGEKLYYMGDWGKYRSDGSIEYLGRQDDQIKIRGVRIELNEIKNALLQHPTVKNAVIRSTIRDDNILLIAYVVCERSPPHRLPYFSHELLAYLANYLPQQFLPNAVIVVEAFSLTSNGKIDVNLLPNVNEIPTPSEHS
jgi:amino acid adenylation domain-containing protein